MLVKATEYDHQIVSESVAAIVCPFGKGLLLFQMPLYDNCIYDTAEYVDSQCDEHKLKGQDGQTQLLPLVYIIRGEFYQRKHLWTCQNKRDAVEFGVGEV